MSVINTRLHLVEDEVPEELEEVAVPCAHNHPHYASQHVTVSIHITAQQFDYCRKSARDQHKLKPTFASVSQLSPADKLQYV